MSTPAKIAGLRQLLARDGRATFKGGASIERVNETDLLVRWPGTEETAYVNDCAYDQLGRAYALALAGPPPPEPPPPARIKPLRGDGSEFGDDPPF